MTTSPSNEPQPSLALPEGLSPDTFDTITVLSSILSRLQNPSTHHTATSAAGSPLASTPSQLANGSGPLTIKDIPAATDELKHKLQKARGQVNELPDVERSIEDQEIEIEELEEKIRRQREVLEGLRDVGMAAKMEREQREGDGGACLMKP